MRRTLTKAGTLAVASLFALGLAQPAMAAQNSTDSAPAAATSSAFFEFTDGTDTFVFKLTDAAKIQTARNMLNGTDTTHRGVMGTVVKTPAWYNSPWKYQLSPSSVSFFEMATEVCDASISYVNDHLTEVGGALLPKNTWCPWGSQLTREIKNP
ncbi:calmodulin-binding protein [Kitasatospora sp. NPDC002227]|uniref:BP74-related protein n=1 Tax=Kitasatospora sp. NPDC002227 TaxID=3154773 RepID=UPI00332D603B